MLDYILIFLMIILSGTIIGWTYKAFVLLEIAVLLIKMIGHLKNKKSIRSNNLIIFMVIMFTYILSMTIVSKVSIFSNWLILLGILICWVCSETVEFARMSKVYIKIMTFLCVSSVILWALAQVGIEIAAQVVDPGNGVLYRINLLYVYRDSNGLQFFGRNWRNFGMFWEPGAFQAFINMALLFHIINNKDKYDKKWYLIAFVFALTIITTFSTTGYILLMFNVLIYLSINKRRFSSKTKFGLFMVCLVAFILILNSSTIVDKFSSESDVHKSLIIRMNDLISGIKIAVINPLVGLGFQSDRYTEVTNAYGIKANSNGLLVVMQQFGLGYFLWYTYMQCRTICQMVKKKTRETIAVILSVLLILFIFMTESLNQNQMFMLLAFDNIFRVKQNNTVENNSGES